MYNPDWEAWNGPERWKIIADLHFWDAGNTDDVSVIIRDWPQNGYDCGPIAGAIVRKFIEDGMEETWEFLSIGSIGSRPPLPCGHILRLNILAHVRQRCMTSFKDYMHFQTDPPLHWEFMELGDDSIYEMQNGGDHARDDRLLRSLTLASSSCRDCHAFGSQHPAAQERKKKWGGEDNHQEEKGDVEEEEEEMPEEEESLCNPDRVKTLLSLIKGHKILRGSRLLRVLRPSLAVTRPSRTSGNDNEEVDIEGEQEQERSRGQLSTSARASRKQVRDWRLGTIARFPRTLKPVPLEAYRGQRFIPHDYNYDDYDDGPMLEMLQQPEVYSVFQEHMTWVMWRDHGYRILADSFQMFYLAPPIQIMDHIMAIGHVAPPPRISWVRSHSPVFFM
jgi:hypothetical protein